MIDVDEWPAKVWELITSLMLSWSIFSTPFLMVYRCSYSCFLCQKLCEQGQSKSNDGCVHQIDLECKDNNQQNGVQSIDFIADVVLAIDILLSFFKMDRINNTLSSIAFNYVTSYFVFDLISTIPGLCVLNSRGAQKFLPLRLFRNVHAAQIVVPVQYIF